MSFAGSTVASFLIPLSQFPLESLPILSRDNVPSLVHKTSTVHPSTLSPNPRFTNTDVRTNVAQSPSNATFNSAWSNELGHGEANGPAPGGPAVHMEGDNDWFDDSHRSPSLPPQLEGPKRYNCGDSKKVPPGGYFPRKLSLMLSDQAMTKYIKLDERQGPKAFNIPNIEAFVANALPKYFPDMNQWGSFQKQLSNYGYKKKDRHKESGTWILRNKNPSDVLHQCKDPPPRKTLPERYPTATTPAAFGTSLEPQDQPDLYTRVDKLERELNATRSELTETRALLSETRTQLQRMMDLVGRMAGLSFGDCSLHSMAHLGPAVGTSSNDFRAHEESNYTNAHYDPTPQREIDSYNRAALQDSFSHRGTEAETTDNTFDPALLVQQPPQPQPPSFASSSSSSSSSSSNLEPTLPRAEDQQSSSEDRPQNLFLCGWMEDGSNSTGFNGFGQEPNVAPPPTGSQNPASNPAATFAPQMSVLPRNSNPNSPRPSGRRAFYGGSQPVPLPQQPPAPSWRLW